MSEPSAFNAIRNYDHALVDARAALAERPGLPAPARLGDGAHAGRGADLATVIAMSGGMVLDSDDLDAALGRAAGVAVDAAARVWEGSAAARSVRVGDSAAVGVGLWARIGCWRCSTGTMSRRRSKRRCRRVRFGYSMHGAGGHDLDVAIERSSGHSVDVAGRMDGRLLAVRCSRRSGSRGDEREEGFRRRRSIRWSSRFDFMQSWIASAATDGGVSPRGRRERVRRPHRRPSGARRPSCRRRAAPRAGRGPLR